MQSGVYGHQPIAHSNFLWKRMRSFEFEREGSPRTPTEEDSGGCLFRLLCNPCFWNASGGSNSCVQGEKRDQDVSSYYESRVGKIRSRIARVLNGGNINVNSNNSGRNSGGMCTNLLFTSPYFMNSK